MRQVLFPMVCHFQSPPVVIECHLWKPLLEYQLLSSKPNDWRLGRMLMRSEIGKPLG
jgi:hypothetical protein